MVTSCALKQQVKFFAAHPRPFHTGVCRDGLHCINLIGIIEGVLPMRLLLAGLAFSLSLLPAVATFAEVVYIGISTPGLYELPTEIAQRKGFYKDEGLDPRKVVVRTNLQVAALIAGELDYSTVSGIIARASIQGLPVKGVMFPWKEPKERIPLAVRQIHSFLRAHRPA